MATKITSTTPQFGNVRSHSNRACKHARKVNYQKVTLENGEKVIMSSREIRTLKKDSQAKAK